MKRKWYQYIVTASGKKGNLVMVLGAVVIFTSLFLPWIEKIFLHSQNVVTGGELLFSGLCAQNNYHILTHSSAISISLTPVLVLLQTGNTVPRLLSFCNVILLSVMLLVVPIPLKSFSYGIICATGGILIVLLGTFTKRT